MKKRDQIALMLSLGYTKKEIAVKTGRSVNTIDNQAQTIYRETGSRNLADITRKIIARYTGLPIEDILFRAVHDVTIAIAAAFLGWCAMQPETIEKLQIVLSSLANIIK